MGNTPGTVSLCSLVPSSNFAHSIKVDAIDASAKVLDSRNNPEQVSEISWLSEYEFDHYQCVHFYQDQNVCLSAIRKTTHYLNLLDLTYFILTTHMY